MRNRSRTKKFKALLKTYKITPKQLAEALGVSRGIVSHWSLGKRRPSKEHITVIAAVVGCSENDVVSCFGIGGE